MADGLWIIVVSSLIAICCSMIGVFLILRRMAMLSDAISHAVLPGIVIGYLVIREMDYGVFLLWSIFAAIGATLLIDLVSRLAKFQKDISMGISF